MKIKNKIIKGGIVISIITLLVIPFHLLYKREIKEESKISLNTENLISYTIDGEIVQEKPTKDSDYIANKISCKNNSNIVWDNDNWQVEMNVDRLDRCIVDFTKDTTREGYRVTVISNDTSALDSTSKTTTNGGIITVYSKGETIASVTGCSGVLEDNKVIVRNVTENQTCNITIKQNRLADVILSKYNNITERTDFSTVFTTTGLYKTTDYDANGNFAGTSYYYTGNPDNWVSFAGKLWRIVRINGDGGVRLLYAGTGNDDAFIGSTFYNNSANDPMYVGWKYGTSGSLENNRDNENLSTIYSYLNTWYKNDIVNKTDGLYSYDKYISYNAIYCSDRNIGNGTYGKENSFDYSPYKRLVDNNNPTLLCNESDRFKDGFGLMTIDEIVYAGGNCAKTNTNAYYYLNKNGGSATGTNNWWTMSPGEWNLTRQYGTVFLINSNSSIVRSYVATDEWARPVISLKPCVQVTGGTGKVDSTTNNSYTLSINKTCVESN